MASNFLLVRAQEKKFKIKLIIPPNMFITLRMNLKQWVANVIVGSVILTVLSGESLFATTRHGTKECTGNSKKQSCTYGVAGYETYNWEQTSDCVSHGDAFDDSAIGNFASSGSQCGTNTFDPPFLCWWIASTLPCGDNSSTNEIPAE